MVYRTYVYHRIAVCTSLDLYVCDGMCFVYDASRHHKMKRRVTRQFSLKREADETRMTASKGWPQYKSKENSLASNNLVPVPQLT